MPDEEEKKGEDDEGNLANACPSSYFGTDSKLAESANYMAHKVLEMGDKLIYNQAVPDTESFVAERIEEDK